MTSPTSPLRHTVQVRPGLGLELREAGRGSPVLVLHGGPGPGSLTLLVDHLASDHRVVAPTHPGWDGTARPDDLDCVPTLAPGPARPPGAEGRDGDRHVLRLGRLPGGPGRPRG